MTTFAPTPITPLDTDRRGNRLFLKREDLLPYSFGGNKARIGLCYLEDMRRKGCTHMVAYGNARSNLCRVLSNLCAGAGVPITILSPADDDGQRRKAFNEELCRMFGAQVVPCQKTNVAQSVQQTLDDLTAAGQKPYYIYGDRFGKGNEATPTAAYVPVYDEIVMQEQALGVRFDMIALATGTGMTQAGLLCGSRGDARRIVGLSVARDAAAAGQHIAAYADAWLQANGLAPLDKSRIEVYDGERAQYGVYGDGVAQVMREMMTRHGVPMDGTYTGKAFYALRRLLASEGTTGQNILFLHTGGTPLFFDALQVENK